MTGIYILFGMLGLFTLGVLIYDLITRPLVVATRTSSTPARPARHDDLPVRNHLRRLKSSCCSTGWPVAKIGNRNIVPDTDSSAPAPAETPPTK
jgi:hypothetical protein